MAPKSLFMRVPSGPEHQLLGNKLWRIHWGVLGCKWATVPTEEMQERT